MDDISNRTLALLLVTSIVVSLGFTVWTLNNLGKGSPTGMAQNEFGNVSVIVASTVSITLNDDFIVNFGTGYINTSCTFLGSNNYANLTKNSDSDAGTYEDTSDCWTGTGAGTGFLVENNGNKNASISVSGPTNSSFFSGYTNPNNYEYGIEIKGRSVTADNGCPNKLNSTIWRDLANNYTICGDLLYAPDGTDRVGVDVHVKLPRDIPSGTYNASRVEFYAVQS